MKIALPSRSALIFSIALTLLIIVVLLSGCSKATQTTQTTTSASQTTAPVTKTIASTASVGTGSKYTIAVIIHNKEIDSISMDELLNLKQVTINADGKTQNGPTLSSILNLVGIKEFNSVTVVGFNKGRLATAQFTLQQADINDKAVLDITDQKTATLSGTEIPSNNWIVDITQIIMQ
jgi:uncharacterized protein YceK